MNKKATTLLEILLASSLGVLLMGGVYSLQLLSERNYRTSSAVIEVLNEAYRGLEELERQTRTASEIVSTHTVGATVYTTGANTMVLKLVSIDINGNIIPNTYDYIIFHPEAGNASRLMETIDANAGKRVDQDRLVIDDLGTVAFSSGGVSLAAIPILSAVNQVDIALTLYKNFGEPVTQNLDIKSSVRMRNR